MRVLFFTANFNFQQYDESNPIMNLHLVEEAREM